MVNNHCQSYIFIYFNCKLFDVMKTRPDIDHIESQNKKMYEALQDIIEQSERTKMIIPADLSDSIRLANSLIKSIES